MLSKISAGFPTIMNITAAVTKSMPVIIVIIIIIYSFVPGGAKTVREQWLKLQSLYPASP